MGKNIDVQIGEVKTSQGKEILKSKAIGSCIAVVAYDATKKVGAIAHVMLPGSAPAKKKPCEKTKYAANAVDALLGRMGRLGSKNGNIEVTLVGGANVLNRKDDTICKDNIESILALLKKKHVKVRTQAVGGTNRRSVSLDVGRGVVFYTEGDKGETQLWSAQRTAE